MADQFLDEEIAKEGIQFKEELKEYQKRNREHFERFESEAQSMGLEG